jgi:ech hydrogenase subunit A
MFPLLTAVAMLFLKEGLFKNAFTRIAALLTGAGSIGLLFNNSVAPHYFVSHSALAETLMFYTELVLAAYLIYAGFKYRRYFVPVLVAAQTGVMVYLEKFSGHTIEVSHNLFVDKFSIIMALIIGVVGGLICIYAIGYMKDFHHQYRKEVKDNRKFFFFLLFIFLSAMFGVVFANNLIWLYFFWEITTLCSFFLIGYKQNQESRDNAFTALELNLLGGLAFAAGIFYLHNFCGTIELDKMLGMGKAVVLIPAVLISLAGITKSAQFPFSKWLLGAMVAPTPVSALLHSSTMVKAGVYIVLRFAFIFQSTMAGFLLALIGAVTFLAGSFMAVSQNDAKKILAYSTIANLGLIIVCAGVGTYEAVWAGILLIIFHAVAKCLLFLCVGTVEHKVHSRNIEQMSGLIVSMPKVSIMMQIGMAGMFLAPFGMLISKWAVLKALVDVSPLLAVFVVFGSAVTLFFWVKWMGQLILVLEPHEDLEGGVNKNEWMPLTVLSGLTVALCGLFPWVASIMIEPYVIGVYGRTMTMSAGNIFIMLCMLAMVLLFPLSFFNYGRQRVKVVDAYLGGANTFNATSFRDALGGVKNMSMKNYYIEGYFGEKKVFKLAVVATIILIAIILAILPF